MRVKSPGGRDTNGFAPLLAVMLARRRRTRVAGRSIDTLRLRYRPARHGQECEGSGGEIHCKIAPVHPWRAGNPREVRHCGNGLKTVPNQRARPGLKPLDSSMSYRPEASNRPRREPMWSERTACPARADFGRRQHHRFAFVHGHCRWCISARRLRLSSRLIASGSFTWTTEQSVRPGSPAKLPSSSSTWRQARTPSRSRRETRQIVSISCRAAFGPP
jgi:hypothetical protein